MFGWNYWFHLHNQLQCLFTLTIRYESKLKKYFVIISLNSNLILHIYYFLRKVSGGKEIRLYVQSSKNPDQKNELDNDLRDLGFYSLEDGDFILVRWVLDTQLWELNKPKSKAAVELKENHCFIEAGRNCFIASNQHSFVKMVC